MTGDDFLFVNAYYDKERKGTSPMYLSLPNQMFFPGTDFENELPELVIMVETLREFIGEGIFLVFYGDPFESFPISAELVLTTDVVDDDKEYLDTVTTPIGTFSFLNLGQDENGDLVDLDIPLLTQEIKEALCLRACETSWTDEYRCDVKLVSRDPMLNFPPERPECYLADTPAEQTAREYWDIHDCEPISDYEEMIQSYRANGLDGEIQFFDDDGEPVDSLSGEEAEEYMEELLDEGAGLWSNEYVIRAYEEVED